MLLLAGAIIQKCRFVELCHVVFLLHIINENIVHAPAEMVSRYACVTLIDVTLTQAKRACTWAGQRRRKWG